MKSRSLSRRLALQAGLATAALVIGASLLVTAYTAAHQLAMTGRSAQDSANLIRATLNRLGLSQATLLTVDSNTSPNDPHVWLLQNGTPVLQSPNANGRPPSGPIRTGLVLGSFPSQHVYVYDPSSKIGILLEAPLAPSLAMLQDMIIADGTIGLAGALIGGLLGYFAARRMLRPVVQLTNAATALRSRRSRLRLLPALSAADDEIGQLGNVLNRLLGDLEVERQRDRAMLAEAAHQLRTPLQIVQGNAQLLMEPGRLSEEDAAESVAAIDLAVHGMIRLANDLLTLESARQQSPEHRPLPLAPWLQGMAEDAQALSPETQVEVELLEAQSLRTDPDLLNRAYWAVLENALHYTPPGGSVRLGADVREDEIRIYVQDSGPGIPPQELPFVTDRFYRGSAGRSGQGGSGLGLAIASAIAGVLGGRLDLECPAGGGTIATLAFRATPQSAREKRVSATSAGTS